MKSQSEKLQKKHQQLNQTDLLKVISHVQRNDGEWILNTVIVEDCDVPFKFKRKQEYKNLKGARVNLTYYPTTESVAGFDVEIMNVVRIRKS